MTQFEVAPLASAKDALEPLMNRETLDHHCEKHHEVYLAQLRALIEGIRARTTLPELIRINAGAVFKAAALADDRLG